MAQNRQDSSKCWASNLVKKLQAFPRPQKVTRGLLESLME